MPHVGSMGYRKLHHVNHILIYSPQAGWIGCELILLKLKFPGTVQRDSIHPLKSRDLGSGITKPYQTNNRCGFLPGPSSLVMMFVTAVVSQLIVWMVVLVLSRFF